MKIHRIITTSDCPFCGSPRTGRLITMPEDTAARLRIQSRYLKQHEYVMPDTDQTGQYNRTCLDCGNKWYLPIRAEHFTLKELQEYCRHKLFNETSDPELGLLRIPEKKKTGHRILGKLTKFTGKLFTGFIHNMIFLPMTDVTKDLIHIIPTNNLQETAQEVVKENDLTFEDLYKTEFSDDDKNNDMQN